MPKLLLHESFMKHEQTSHKANFIYLYIASLKSYWSCFYILQLTLDVKIIAVPFRW